MPEFYIKKGLADVLLTDWIAAHTEEPFIRVNIEVESSHERLRRSFHGLLLDWFNCGEWSCNGASIHTMEKFKSYYKYVGCNYVGYGYGYNGEQFTNIIDKKTNEVIQTALDCLYTAYPKARPEDIYVITKSWTKMNKKEKSNALNVLLTEIRYSMTNDQKVLKRVAEITGDIELLNDINYHKNIGE